MSNEMKALVKARAEPGLWMERRPVPEIGPDDVLIKIHKTGICGTDIHIWNWDEWAAKTVPVPLVTGHEFAGEIVEMGRNVEGLHIGQRCSGEGHLIGRHSRQSRSGRFHLDPETRGIGVHEPGAFAEYLRLPAFNVVPLPDAIDDEIGAILDRMRRRQVRYCWTLAAELRGIPVVDGVRELTPEDPAAESSTDLLNRQAADVGELVNSGFIGDQARLVLMTANTGAATAQSGLERIRNEPIPLHYDFYIRVLAWFVGVMAFNRLDGAAQNHIGSVVVGVLLLPPLAARRESTGTPNTARSGCVRPSIERFISIRSGHLESLHSSSHVSSDCL